MEGKRRKPLGKSLVEKGLITEEQLWTALEEQKRTGLYLRQVLLKMGMIDEEHILEFFEEELGIPTLDLSTYTMDEDVVRMLPEKIARRYQAVPVFKIGDTLTVAMADPLDVVALDEIRAATGVEVEVVMSSEAQVVEAIEQYFPFGGSLEEVGVAEPDGKDAPPEAEATIPDAPVVKLVKAILRQAMREGASDVHIEPGEGKLRVRFRVDGMLREVSSHRLSLHASVVSRIKVMANLDIAERRLPQDGRSRVVLEGKELDLRISTFPTIGGENVVIRVLDKTAVLLDLSRVGLKQEQLGIVEDVIRRPNGIVLVAGPTGSGKTTTLYACLNTITSIEKNIVTLEDPVEYELPLIRQTQVDPEIGLSFAAGLRSLLRQDPDVIMVGEIRDRETAEIAIRSSLTGHLVLSTVHTNDAAGAVARLMEMEVEPFLISSALLAVIGQRLVRKVCTKCKQSYEPPPDMLEQLGIEGRDGDFVRGEGCKVCGQTGFKGRVGVFETLVVAEEIQRLISAGAPMEDIAREARRMGMKTMRQIALEKAAAGMTTLEEVVRVTKRDTRLGQSETAEWQLTPTVQEPQTARSDEAWSKE